MEPTINQIKWIKDNQHLEINNLQPNKHTSPNTMHGSKFFCEPTTQTLYMMMALEMHTQIVRWYVSPSVMQVHISYMDIKIIDNFLTGKNRNFSNNFEFMYIFGWLLVKNNL